MMHMLNLEPWVLSQDQASKGGALLVERKIGETRECGFKFSKARRGSVWARKLLTIECQRPIGAMDRNQTATEVPCLDGEAGALLTLQRECIEIGAGNTLKGRDGVRTNPLMRLRVTEAQPQVACVHQQGRSRIEVGGHRHHFATPCDHEVLHA